MAFHPSTDVFDEIAPHPDGIDPATELVHERAYVVRAYRKDASTLVLRGAVRDQKPPGLYIADDDEPMTVHHMMVDLHIAVPSMEIIAAKAVLATHPHASCRRIEDHYDNLLGLSIARGFTHKVRELFGGPRGCTHTTALLQAMAPVAVQSMWSFRFAAARDNPGSRPLDSPEARAQLVANNLNTCHVWAEDGEHVAAIRSGEPHAVPVWIAKRLEALGRTPENWRSRK